MCANPIHLQQYLVIEESYGKTMSICSVVHSYMQWSLLQMENSQVLLSNFSLIRLNSSKNKTEQVVL